MGDFGYSLKELVGQRGILSCYSDGVEILHNLTKFISGNEAKFDAVHVRNDQYAITLRRPRQTMNVSER